LERATTDVWKKQKTSNRKKVGVAERENKNTATRTRESRTLGFPTNGKQSIPKNNHPQHAHARGKRPRSPGKKRPALERFEKSMSTHQQRRHKCKGEKGKLTSNPEKRKAQKNR